MSAPTSDTSLPLDGALREALGLSESESLSLWDVGAHAILLGREAATANGAPVAAPALTADLERFPLRDLFSWIEGTARSGLLLFSHGEQRKSVYLHRGEVVFAGSNQMSDRIGECLLRAGVLSLDQLREAERCFEPPMRFGKVLVERGFLSPRELWNGVKYQVEEIVRSLFVVRSGRVVLFDGDVPPDNVVRLALPTRRLVEEGLQRRDELHKFMAVLEGPRVELAVVDSHPPNLSRHERALFDAIRFQSRFHPLCESLGCDRETAARSIQLLRLVGAVKLVRTPDDEIESHEGDRIAKETMREAVTQGVKLIGELSAPITRVESPDAIRTRLQSAVEEAAGRYPALLSGLEVAAGGWLDAEALLERLLRLPGEHEDQLLAALGELVAYVEFELVNHPAVDDADDVLMSLRDRRASLFGRT